MQLETQTSTDLHLASGVFQKPKFGEFIGHFDKAAANIIQRLHTDTDNNAFSGNVR